MSEGLRPSQERWYSAAPAVSPVVGIAGMSVSGDFACTKCGEPITVGDLLPRCPHCGCGEWEPLPTRWTAGGRTDEALRRRTTECLSLPRVVEAIDSELTTDEREHVESCDFCRRRLEFALGLGETWPGPAVGGSLPARVIRMLYGAQAYTLGASSWRTILRRVPSLSVLAAIDVASVFLGFWLAAWLAGYPFGGSVPVGVALVVAIVFWQKGCYEMRERRSGSRLASAVALVAALLFVVTAVSVHEPRIVAAVSAGLAAGIAALTALRAGYERVSSRMLHVLGVRHRVIIVGDVGRVQILHHALGEQRAGIAYDYLGAVLVKSEQDASGTWPLDVGPVLGTLANLPSIIPDLEPNEIVVAHGLDPNRLLGLRTLLAEKKVRLLMPAQYYSYQRRERLQLVEILPWALSGRAWAAKRTFDWLVVLLVGIGLAPLWLGIALAVRLTSRGPMLVRERRVGYNGAAFDMFRFRTTVWHGKPERLTHVGKLLRRFALDALPHLLNVAWGEMTLVGPLALREHELRGVRTPSRTQLVLPGVTGLCHINPDRQLQTRMQLDLQYVDDWSIWRDLMLLCTSLWFVARTRPEAYERMRSPLRSV